MYPNKARYMALNMALHIALIELLAFQTPRLQARPQVKLQVGLQARPKRGSMWILIS